MVVYKIIYGVKLFLMKLAAYSVETYAFKV